MRPPSILIETALSIRTSRRTVPHRAVNSTAARGDFVMCSDFVQNQRIDRGTPASDSNPRVCQRR